MAKIVFVIGQAVYTVWLYVAVFDGMSVSSAEYQAVITNPMFVLSTTSAVCYT